MGAAPFSLSGGKVIERYSGPRKYAGLVILLDALGMKGVWTRKNPFHVLQRWEEVYIAFESAINNTIIPSPNISIQFKTFSDTVLITAADKVFLQQNPARFFSFMAHCIMAPFLTGLFKNIYLRGVISTGEFYQSTKMAVGPAIDDAATYYESPNWIGISVTPTASSLLSLSHDTSDLLVPYNIAYKGGMAKIGWALAWPNYASAGKTLLQANSGYRVSYSQKS